MDKNAGTRISQRVRKQSTLNYDISALLADLKQDQFEAVMAR